MQIKGEKVILKAMAKKDKNAFYKLATESYGSDFWYDKELKAKRTKKSFFEDWNDDYFNPRKLNKGQCFWIMKDAEKIGQINYNKIDTDNKNVELDIIIGRKENMGKGYGTDALRALMKYLFNSFDIHKIFIKPNANNPMAVLAYEKVGFKKEGTLREQAFWQGKFTDELFLGVLRKEFFKK